MMEAQGNTGKRGKFDKHPPKQSRNLFSDIVNFFISTPKKKSLVAFDTEDERMKYTQSIMQRLGIEVTKYRMLNIHRIGIEAPASYIFQELLRWNGDSSCWPNHIARVKLVDNDLQEIKVDLLGFRFLRLFHLDAIKILKFPDPSDVDNARYLLYNCSGGYPIGIFSMYVRTSIPERGETEMSQLFILVGFNFYGNETLSLLKPMTQTWQWIHNRVTTNIAHRFRQLCEWRFEKICNPGEMGRMNDE
jgi:hypothetical protein